VHSFTQPQVGASNRERFEGLALNDGIRLPAGPPFSTSTRYLVSMWFMGAPTASCHPQLGSCEAVEEGAAGTGAH
jgi:hypothetical protein